MSTRLPLVALALLACNNPLSNELFYADELFLEVFPDTRRLGFSDAVASYPRNTDDPILLAAIHEAEEVEPALTLIIGVGDLLRNAEPTSRTETSRSWAPRSVAAPAGAEVDLWFLRAEIARSSPESDFSWRIEGSREEAGDYVVLGSGTHRTDGGGDVFWDFPATAALYGIPIEDAVLEATYTGNAERHTEIAIVVSSIARAEYSFDGDHFFGWVGSVALDENPVTGAGQIYIRPDGAGRGIAVVFPEGVEEVQQTCWGLAGLSEYARGSLLHDHGVESDCLAEDVF